MNFKNYYELLRFNMIVLRRSYVFIKILKLQRALGSPGGILVMVLEVLVI